MRRAAGSGYTGIVLGDFKFGRLAEMDAHYFANARRIKEAAASLKLEIMPAVFPIGDSRSLLASDRNLAEGLPVKDALFVVKDGVAGLEPDPPVALRGGDLASAQRIKVKPFRQYHLSVRVKTEKLRGTPRLTVLGGGGRGLAFADLGVGKTQDWTLHHSVFNSLDNDEVTIELVCDRCRAGSLRSEGAAIE
ncbi:MAG: hypothetical protein ACREQQ_08385, partial [Candidatus Binatia bacterium]